jgi:hypothetical protein
MTEAPTRWELIRDVLVLQVKLAVDAIRDLVLSPVSIVAGILDLLAGGERPGRLFYSVLLAGRRSERIINLFGDADRVQPRPPGPASADPAALDVLVARVERMLVEQVERGGMTASAKAAIDRSLDALAQARSRGRGERPPS